MHVFRTIYIFVYQETFYLTEVPHGSILGPLRYRNATGVYEYISDFIENCCTIELPQTFFALMAKIN